MTSTRDSLGSMIKVHREHRTLTQEHVAQKCGVNTNRTAVAHLEQGLRLPRPEVLSAICEYLEIPKPLWEPFTHEESLLRFEFEDGLSELVGRPVNLDMHDPPAQKTAETLISELFSSNPTPEQLLNTFNSILVYYGVGPVFAADDAKTSALDKFPLWSGYFSYSRCFQWVFKAAGLLGVAGTIVCLIGSSPELFPISGSN